MGLLMATLWEKLQFWRKKMPKINEDFALITVTSENDSSFPKTLAVELLVDKYKDVLYYYQNAKFEQIDGNGILSFEYCLLNSGTHSEDELKKDEEFKKLTGDILVEITTTADRNNIEIRENNTEEPDL